MNDTGTKYAIDAVSAGLVAATLSEWLPPIAAILTIIWTAIRIVETRTVQRWIFGKTPRSRSGD